MLSSGCVASQYGGSSINPLACANLNLPHLNGGNDGWHIRLGWVVDHPIMSSLILAVLLTMVKAVVQAIRTQRERS